MGTGPEDQKPVLEQETTQSKEAAPDAAQNTTEAAAAAEVTGGLSGQEQKPAHEIYFDEVNKSNINSLSIAKKFWEPIREAFKKIGKKDCNDDGVLAFIKQNHPELFD